MPGCRQRQSWCAPACLRQISAATTESWQRCWQGRAGAPGDRGRPAPGPWQRPRTLEAAGCQDKVELRLGDGLSVLREGEAATIVLAGVSAQTTWEILEKAPWVFQPGGPRLVLVPATRHGDLRRWLWQKGFALAADRPVQAAGRWYAVMAAEYTGQSRQPTLAQCLFGETGCWPKGLPMQPAAGKAAQTAAGCAGRHPAGR